MAQRNKSNYFDDIERLAESMKNFNQSEFDDIESQSDLNSFLDGYFGDDSYKKLVSGTRKSQLMKSVIFRQSGGKDLNKDKQQTADTVYPATDKGKKQYKKTGASKSDLSGLDTKKGKPRPSRQFTEYGKIKERIVKIRPITIKLKSGKTYTRYIDSKGRFARRQTGNK